MRILRKNNLLNAQLSMGFYQFIIQDLFYLSEFRDGEVTLVLGRELQV